MLVVDTCDTAILFIDYNAKVSVLKNETILLDAYHGAAPKAAARTRIRPGNNLQNPVAKSRYSLYRYSVLLHSATQLPDRPGTWMNNSSLWVTNDESFRIARY